MGNEDNSNLNVILGQLEDELKAIKSARDQAAGVIAANGELSANLERLIASSKELVEESGDQTKKAAKSLSAEADRLAGQSEAIAKQAAESQAAIEKATSDAAAKASTQISEYAERAMDNLNEGINDAKGKVDGAAESAKAAARDIKESSDALLKANETTLAESNHQIEDAKALLEKTQEHLADIDTRIATLKEFDTKTLAEEIEGLKASEADNMAALKSRLTGVTIMAATCIVACLATLAKLLFA